MVLWKVVDSYKGERYEVRISLSDLPLIEVEVRKGNSFVMLVSCGGEEYFNFNLGESVLFHVNVKADTGSANRFLDNLALFLRHAKCVKEVRRNA